MYERHIQRLHLAAYISSVYDEVIFLTENSRLLKSIYTLNEDACRSIRQNRNFVIPSFGEKTLKVNRSVIKKKLRQDSETTYVEEDSQSCMAKSGREGALYAKPLEWVSPIGNVVIKAKIHIGTICGKLLQANKVLWIT